MVVGTVGGDHCPGGYAPALRAPVAGPVLAPPSPAPARTALGTHRGPGPRGCLGIPQELPLGVPWFGDPGTLLIRVGWVPWMRV